MNNSGRSQTVLILAPSANDAVVASNVLNQANISAVGCRELSALCAGIRAGCGAVIISEEALTSDSVDRLRAVLDLQEAWSDLPIILLTNTDVARAAEIFSRSSNISLLERPFSQLTLIHSVHVALRARLKQYEVRDLLVALQKSKEHAERANQAKTEFLANMSHEIRTPIGAIMGFIDIIKNSDGNPSDQSKYMKIIDRNSLQLLRLIDDILDLSKVEAGKMTIEHLNFHLGEFISDFVSSQRFKAAEKGLQFHLNFATPLPTQISSDPVRLRQILSNIVGNAIKFTESGSVELVISYNNPFLHFLVKDTGIGLSPEQVSTIFKPFAQADSSTTRKFGGTGLGLVLSRRLAEALGGTLVLQSSFVNVGSTFAIDIKPECPADSVMMNQSTLKSESFRKKKNIQPELLKGLKVLLIEDSPDNQVLIETYLRKTGAEVLIKSNGSEGAEAALVENHDLILMGLQMPVMGGHEATRKLRKLQYSKPIIALTAHAMNEEKLKCMESGFNEYLTKPVQRNLLIEVLQRYAPQSYQN